MLLVDWVRQWMRRLRDSLVLTPPGRSDDVAVFTERTPPAPPAAPAMSEPGERQAVAIQPHQTPGSSVAPEEYRRWRNLVGQFFSGTAPERMSVPASLELAKLRIRSLPARLTVQGHLDLRQCQRLRRIGDGLTVEGDLAIGGRCSQVFWWEQHLRKESDDVCPGTEPLGRLGREAQCPLARLPENLLVRGDLRLRSCHRLERLPDAFRFGKSLIIESCQSLHSLPDPLKISGDLILKGCRSLVSLPTAIQVAGNIRLIGLPIRQLPRDIRLGGSLVLEDCPLLTELPEGLHVLGDMILRRCPVRSLPRDLHVEGDLTVERCSEEVQIPAGLFVAGAIRFHRCRGLVAIPPHVRVRSSLGLIGCDRLRTLPEGLRIPHTLNLRGCTALEELPRGLKVGQEIQRTTRSPSLILCDCTALKSLPEDLDVRGPIDVAGSGITDLSQGLSSRCQILWRGFAVRPAVVFHPETLGPQAILREPNAELRRVMLERLGVDNVLRMASARILDEDRDPGGVRRLVDVLLGHQRRRYLHCRCPSTNREYLLRVPPNVLRCSEAAAWLAGFDNPKNYRPVLET